MFFQHKQHIESIWKWWQGLHFVKNIYPKSINRISTIQNNYERIILEDFDKEMLINK